MLQGSSALFAGHAMAGCKILAHYQTAEIFGLMLFPPTEAQ
jgi:hypothetical protein